MKGADVKVGGYYLAKVSGQITTVRVTYLSIRYTGHGATERRHDAWCCVNVKTGRNVMVKSAQRFCKEVTS